MNRISTNIAHLDAILGGGFPEASLNIIAGAPGTGKTVLVQQMVWGLASPRRKVLYLSTVNEPLSKIIRYVQGFPFFDLDKVGKSLLYEDLGPLLVKAPVEEVLTAIEAMVLKHHPAVLVVDSFRALGDLAEDPVTFRRGLYGLSGVLTSTGCTTFLVGEYRGDEVVAAPEAAVADGVLQLLSERRGIRQFRYLSVVKLRGSGFVDGHHAFRITAEGVRIFPRFVTPPKPEHYTTSEERLSTGVAALDDMLGGGLLRGSSTLVMGPAGSGKTTVGLAATFAALGRGETVTLATFAEDPNQIVAVARKLGWDARGAMDQATLRHLYASPIELDIDEQVLRIAESIAESGSRTVVIDSLSDLEAVAFDEARFRSYVFSLVQYFKDRGVTALMIYERTLDDNVGGPPRGLSRFADNIVNLRFADEDGGFGHRLQVMKTRGSAHSYAIRAFAINEKGMQVARPGGRARADADRRAPPRGGAPSRARRGGTR
jgi:circadian clock protein KaiC